MEDRFFKYAVIVSLVFHAFLFTRLYMAERKAAVFGKKPELSYHLNVPPPPSSEALARQVRDMALPEAVLTASEAKVAETPGQQGPQDFPAIFEAGLDQASQFKVFERAPEKVKGLKVTKEVSVPILKSEKINTPAYATYYQIVRDRIRDRAYTNYTKLSVGEIYLTFIIRADGSLSGLQVLESKSEANEFLRAVGIKSVQEAASFPPFPKDLNYPELTFNVQISFQFREGE